VRQASEHLGCNLYLITFDDGTIQIIGGAVVGRTNASGFFMVAGAGKMSCNLEAIMSVCFGRLDFAFFFSSLRLQRRSTFRDSTRAQCLSCDSSSRRLGAALNVHH
jgi:hypothetical protein